MYHMVVLVVVLSACGAAPADASEPIPRDIEAGMFVDEVYMHEDVVKVILRVELGLLPKREQNYLFTLHLNKENGEVVEWKCDGPLTVPRVVVRGDESAVGAWPTFPILKECSTARFTWFVAEGDVESQIEISRDERLPFLLVRDGDALRWRHDPGSAFRVRPLQRGGKSYRGQVRFWPTENDTWTVYDGFSHHVKDDEWLTRCLESLSKDGEDLGAAELILTDDGSYLVVVPSRLALPSKIGRTGIEADGNQEFLYYKREQYHVRSSKWPCRGVACSFVTIGGELASVMNVERTSRESPDLKPTDLVVGIAATNEVRRWENVCETGIFGGWPRSIQCDSKNGVLWAAIREWKSDRGAIAPRDGRYFGKTNVRVLKWNWNADRRTHTDIAFDKLWLEAFESQQKAKVPAKK